MLPGRWERDNQQAMETTHAYADFLMFLGIAVVVLPACRLLRLSPILGFLLVGAVVGPQGLGGLALNATTSGLGELGVVFLLFMIGLELSVERLATMTRYVFGLGMLQVAISSAVFVALGLAIGLKPVAAMILAVALAFSSTAFVLQILNEQGLALSRLGRRAIAILILQDLAVVPLLVAVPIAAGEAIDLTASIGRTAGMAVAAVAVILAVGRYALRPLFRLVAQHGAAELFLAATLLVVVGTSLITESVGLSASLGAFLAGMMLAETEFRHQIEAEIEPYRGLLLGLFFLLIGMRIDPISMLRNVEFILIGLLVILIVKAGIIVLLGRRFGLSGSTALQLGLLLGQVGEFAFVVIDSMLEGHLIEPALYDVLVPIIALGMALTPPLAALGERYVLRRARAKADLEAPESGQGDHVIVFGFGRVGQTLVAVLQQEGVPVLAIDRDPRLVLEGRQKGLPVLFGDGGRPRLLSRLAPEKARAVVLTMNSRRANARVLEAVRRDHPHLPIIVRARSIDEVPAFRKGGADHVVTEAFEGSLRMAGQLMALFGKSDQAIEERLNAARDQLYPPKINSSRS
ncbi:MAG: cation:proton antiporter [Rhodospirillales bacterium]|nr:cation:proton antiporter [Rhodospirillales bacterium]